MDLPYFFTDSQIKGNNIELNEETSRHVVQVLRMDEGKKLMLTNGKGETYKVEIISAHKKHCVVSILDNTLVPKTEGEISIAISLLKNASRFEWFLEKAVEIGVANIFPLICHRTEKQHFRYDRMKAITISAMLQSKQSWLPALSEPIKFNDFIVRNFEGNKFIAHCEDDENKVSFPASSKDNKSLILIGPEGEFDPEEIRSAMYNKFVPASLGNTRLRTETAGIVAATLLCNR